MSAQERPDTGARKPYYRHQRGESGIVGKVDKDGEPIVLPSAPWEDFVESAPEEARIDWDDKKDVELTSSHKRTRSQMLEDNFGPSQAPKVTTKKEKPESVKSLVGSISEIFRPELDDDRTLWKSGDFKVETNHLFDRALAVYGKIRETTFETYFDYNYCRALTDKISEMAKHHNALYDGGIAEKFENNDKLYKKDKGIRQKVDAFYELFRGCFNDFVRGILAFNKEGEPVLDQDLKRRFQFFQNFVYKLVKKVEKELLTFKDAFKGFLDELAALPEEHENKRVKTGNPIVSSTGELEVMGDEPGPVLPGNAPN